VGINLGLFGTMGYFGVYLTKASKGQGILAFLVSSVLFSVLSYIAISYVFGSATAELTTHTGSLAGADAADTPRAAPAAGNVIGAGVIAFVIPFLAGMIGCLIGGAVKNKALGSGGAAARAAAV